MRRGTTYLAFGALVGGYLLLRRSDAHLCAVLPLWLRAVDSLGGRTIDPSPYPETEAGLAEYLLEARAPDVDLPEPLPPRRFWPKTAALLLAGEQAGGEAQVLAHYRPGDAGPLGDASGLVMGYPDEIEAQAAEQALSQMGTDEPWLRIEARRRDRVVALSLLGGPNCCLS